MAMKESILLFGGNSDERLVSVASAQNLSAQFRFSQLWFLNTAGAVFRVSPAELESHTKVFETEVRPRENVLWPSIEKGLPFLQNKIVFLGFHGTEGEDVTLQSTFEKAKISFTGSGAAASRSCFEKDKAKKVVSQVNIRVAPERVLTQSEIKKDPSTVQSFFEKYKKIVLKPIASGSSVGLNIVHDAASLKSAIDAVAISRYGIYIIEEFIDGRELTVGVFDDGHNTKALCASEVVLNAGHSFDYQGKYLGRGTTEVTPARLTFEEAKAANHLAVEAHKSLGCYGYSRTDMILTSSGLVYLETNTLPGLTRASFVPQQLAECKITVPQFIEGQLELAEKRYSKL